MFELIPLERHLFLIIVLLSAVSSVLAHVQLKKEMRFRRLIIAFSIAQVSLAAMLLVLRAAAIKAFPVTGIFESMLILMVFVGITFLLISMFVRQVWFLSTMVWVLFIMTLLTATVAKPVAALQQAAQTPWVAFHALSMALAGAMIVFASAMSVLFLSSRRRLKSKRFLSLFGRMPTIESLEALMLLGLRLSFASMTLGLFSGIGLAAVKSSGLGMSPGDWMTDSKIVLIAAAWLFLLAVLILRCSAFSAKTIAGLTLFICFLILFAFIGSKIFCNSDHDFESKPTSKTLNVNSSCRYY